MTIALGVLCSGGVVLGVDTQHSLGEGQFPDRKIFTFPKRGNHQVIAAGFGNSDSLRLAAEEIEITLDGSASTVREVKAQVSAALSAVYSNHIDPCPIEERRDFDFSFLVAIQLGVSARLFRTNRTMVVEVRDRWTMGVGEQFARYALSAFLGSHPVPDIAAQIAAYVIGMTKETMEGVGFATDIHVLECDGSHWGLHLPEVIEIEKTFADLLHRFQFAISTIVSADETVGRSALLSMEDPLMAMRGARLKRQALRSMRVASLQATQPDLQPTTGDPSLPLPSPESLGGSDES